MKNSILDSSENKCTGSGACVAICRKKAIDLKFDENGFRKPIIDYEKCIECGACKKICPKYEKIERYDLSQNVLSAFSKDLDVRHASASGGIGYELAKAGILKGYEVWGCIYENETNTAKHVPASTLEEIEAFQGSKYLHSVLVDFYDELIYGDRPKLMLFGLPCQIRAARNIMDSLKIKKDVILVDLFCRGVPSQIIWDNYLKHIKAENGINEILTCKFRDKKYGWHSCQMTIDGGNTKYTQAASKDLFYKVYTSGYAFRDSCYYCNLKLEKSYSDIRIGDHWGETHKDNEDGISLVIINTDSGKKFWNTNITNRVNFEEVPFDEVKTAQGLIYNSYSHKVKLMRKELKKRDLVTVANKLCKPPLAVRFYLSLPEGVKNIYRKHIKNSK